MLIIGWGGGVTQDLGEVAPTTCPHCHNPVFLHQITSNKQISLFFVPIVPYASNVYLACPICHSGVQLQPAQIPAADHMRGTTMRFRHGILDETAYRTAVGRFWASLGIALSGDQVLHPSPTIPMPISPAVPPAALAEQLAGIGKLHADGLLTDEQFAEAKRRVIEG